MFTQPGNRIYHYCKLSTAIEQILLYKRLLLSPIINTNDPRENKSFSFGATYLDNVDIGNLDERNEEISKILREDCKIISFTEDSRPSFWGYESSRMWSYYGDNHKGLCLELDKSEFLKENATIINKNLFQKIDYYEFDPLNPIKSRFVDHTKMVNMGKEQYLQNEFRFEHLEHLYFTKNKEWESEHETRLVHFSKTEENEYCSIENCIRNIYLGVDFHLSYLPSIKALCPGIDLSKLRFRDVRLVPFPLD